MFSRRIVSRWQRTMRSAMKAARSAVALPPCSISCSAAVRILSRALVLLVPLGDAGVEIPAVVVEPRRVGDRAHLVEPLVLELAEADRDVGDLHAGVVDVVLDFDRRGRGSAAAGRRRRRARRCAGARCGPPCSG